MGDKMSEARSIAAHIRDNRSRRGISQPAATNQVQTSKKRKRLSASPPARQQKRRKRAFTPRRNTTKAQKSPSKSGHSLRPRPNLDYTDPSLSSMSEEPLPDQDSNGAESQDEEGVVNFDSAALAKKDWEDLHEPDEPTPDDLAFVVPEDHVVNDEASFNEGEEDDESSFRDSSEVSEAEILNSGEPDDQDQDQENDGEHDQDHDHDQDQENHDQEHGEQDQDQENDGEHDQHQDQENHDQEHGEHDQEHGEHDQEHGEHDQDQDQEHNGEHDQDKDQENYDQEHGEHDQDQENDGHEHGEQEQDQENDDQEHGDQDQEHGEQDQENEGEQDQECHGHDLDKQKSKKKKRKDKKDKEKKNKKPKQVRAAVEQKRKDKEKEKKSKKVRVVVEPSNTEKSSFEEVEKRMAQLNEKTSPNSKSEVRNQFVRSVCRLLETLPQYGVSLVVSATQKTGKLKSVVCGDAEYSVNTAPTVDIENHRQSPVKVKPTDSGEQLFGLPKHVVDALKTCQFSQSTRESMSRQSQQLVVNNTVVDSVPEAAFIVEEKLPVLDFDDNTREHIYRVLGDLERLQTTHVDVTVFFKLKMFYLGGILDFLGTKYRDELRAAAGGSISDRILDGHVNGKLYDLFGKSVKDGTLNAITPDEYDTRDAMSCPPKSPVKRDGFRTWKCRLAKFYAVCKCCKDLLYSDLSYSFIARSFCDLESAKQIFRFIKDHPDEYSNWN